jgi:5,10-methylenetetrahydrofolate reductase
MNIQKRLQSGKFVVLAEMNTPKGVDISRFMTYAQHIRGRIDGVVVPDMDNGVMRMSALAGGALLQQQGIETLINVYGRDRNRMALQGDMLAAHVLGIQNLIVVQGENMACSDHRDAPPVNDLDEMGVLNAIRNLQAGKDMAGFDLDGVPQFYVGCHMAPFADNAAMDAEIELARGKIAAGAGFVITPPVFDMRRFGEFMKKAATLQVPIIPTVFLIKSVAVARYIATNEPGAHISEDLIRRIRTSSDREMEGVRIAGETIAQLRKEAGGVLLQTMGWEHRLPAILDAAGL